MADLMTRQNEACARWQKTRDPRDMERLLSECEGLILRNAQSVMRGRNDAEDIKSEGRLAVMRAAETWDPERGSFWTYAGFWVREAARSYVRTSGSVVSARASKSAMKVFARAGRPDATPESLSAETGLPVSEVGRLLAIRAGSFAEVTEDLGEDGAEESISDSGVRLIAGLISDMPARTRDILENRFREEPETLESIAKRYGVSVERIRQIKNEALAELRKKLTEKGLTFDDF